MPACRRALATLVAVTLLISLLPPAPALAAPREVRFVIGEAYVAVDGGLRPIDARPFTRDGRTFVPVRALALALGVPETGIQWDPGRRTVTLRSGAATVEMAVGSRLLSLNGRVTRMDVSPLLVSGRTYLPARWVAEALGFRVEWLAAEQTVRIVPGSSDAEAPPAGEQAGDVKDVIRQARVHVLVLRTYDAAGRPLAQGSAVAVAPNAILTNWHVIADAASAAAVDDAGREIEVVGLLAADADRDLALLAVDAGPAPARLGSAGSLEVGDVVIAIGSPLGLQNTVSMGIVSAFRDADGTRLIQTTAPISPGSSGGGLFDARGALVGITFAQFQEGQNLNLAIPIEAAAPLLQRAAAQPAPLPGRPPAAGIGGSESARVAAFLTETLSAWSTPAGTFAFSRFAEGAPLDDFPVVVTGVFDSDSYLVWLRLDDRERQAILDDVVDAMIAASGDLDFAFVAFYQDRWSTYPSTFESSEITPGPSPGTWVVTHWVAYAVRERGQVVWNLQP